MTELSYLRRASLRTVPVIQFLTVLVEDVDASPKSSQGASLGCLQSERLRPDLFLLMRWGWLDLGQAASLLNLLLLHPDDPPRELVPQWAQMLVR